MKAIKLIIALVSLALFFLSVSLIASPFLFPMTGEEPGTSTLIVFVVGGVLGLIGSVYLWAWNFKKSRSGSTF